jgi:tRNA-modifying protein YgfZ
MSSMLREVPLGTVRVRGPDAQSWLNGLLSQDLARLTPSDAIGSLFLTKQGKVRASLVVVRDGDSLLLGVIGMSASTLGDELDPYLVMEDAEWAVESEARWYVGALSPAESGRLSEVDRVLAREFPYLGPGGVVVVAHGELPAQVREFVATDDAVFDAFRLDRGIPLFGIDYSEADNPHEASLDKTHISFQKGCYLGQEVVCMQEMRGKVKRRVVRVEAEATLDPRLTPGASITSEAGEQVGVLTTARDGRGLGKVKAPLDVPGSRVLVGEVPCRVLALEPGTLWASSQGADRVPK